MSQRAQTPVTVGSAAPLLLKETGEVALFSSVFIPTWRHWERYVASELQDVTHSPLKNGAHIPERHPRGWPLKLPVPSTLKGPVLWN